MTCCFQKEEAQRHLNRDLQACVYLLVQSNEELLFSGGVQFVSIACLQILQPTRTRAWGG